MVQLGRYSIPNGRAKGRRSSEFDPVQLRRGTTVEMEHTTDSRIAERIAMDHLVEDPNYYKKLARIHLDGSRYRRKALGDAACSTSPRWVRGGLGFLLGGTLGGMLGGGIASAMALNAASAAQTSTTGALANVKTGLLIALGISFVGGAAGLAIGAWKPEC